eukprot:CAMPEP_0172553452 /NCGR_PEP_ID=MMETSP1067-20121228/50987_1 /TAXON_ID=265564 ORGANISM="Thalassiosira punctigera, Strain Tpunct2005C2" /NCGR_SAMPLE_ID=MMETSP1067 /ASSEMBLY_ACC=CAM_ASM_000444 /LENGTH=441 /DNA_ID=CAMNT_0013341643 /DNA_START=26 /DNA_END=1348 /DNA_ORIENTATION=-
MKHLLPSVAMAIIASATTSVGVARGFNFAKHLARSRPRFQTSSASASLVSFRRSPITTSFHRAVSVCFVGPDNATKDGEGSLSTALSLAPPADESTTASSSSVDDDADEIERTARDSLGITGSLPAPVDFGGVPYLDTSSLDASRAHRVVFVLGGPGAGKGTQSERIVDTYRCVHLSVGELLRAGAERDDYPHADLVKECLVQGNIVPVALSLGLLRIAMDEKAAEEDSEHGSRIFLVDGFPRNYDNVQGWMEHMPSYTAVLGALVYNCPMEVLEQRIMARAETSGRSDDNLESARRRFCTFRKQTEPVVRALERVEDLQAEENSGGSQLDIVNIDATGTVEEVWKATEAAMDAYVKNDVLTANANLLKAIKEGDVEKFTNLCNGELEVDPIYDGPTKSFISNAEVHIQNGIKAVVSYDRKVKDELIVRETRNWNHGRKGW